MLYQKKETICLELGNKQILGHCYWCRGLLARALGNTEEEQKKLRAALALFTELQMSREMPWQRTSRRRRPQALRSLKLE